MKHISEGRHVRGGKRGNGGRMNVIVVAFVLCVCVYDGFVFHRAGALSHDKDGKNERYTVRVYVCMYVCTSLANMQHFVLNLNVGD